MNNQTGAYLYAFTATGRALHLLAPIEDEALCHVRVVEAATAKDADAPICQKCLSAYEVREMFAGMRTAP